MCNVGSSGGGLAVGTHMARLTLHRQHLDEVRILQTDAFPFAVLVATAGILELAAEVPLNRLHGIPLLLPMAHAVFEPHHLGVVA